MMIREALLAMGYREVRPGIWLKPVGFHSFCFKEPTSMWVNYFLNTKGEVHAYDSQPLRKEDHPLRWLKYQEAFTRINVEASAKSEFHLEGVDWAGLT